MTRRIEIRIVGCCCRSALTPEVRGERRDERVEAVGGMTDHLRDRTYAPKCRGVNRELGGDDLVQRSDALGHGEQLLRKLGHERIDRVRHVFGLLHQSILSGSLRRGNGGAA